MKTITITSNEIEELFTQHILICYPGATRLHADDTISKYVNGEFIRKQSCRRKDWSYDWVENIKQEDIDTEYFNLDYTRIK